MGWASYRELAKQKITLAGRDASFKGTSNEWNEKMLAEAKAFNQTLKQCEKSILLMHKATNNMLGTSQLVLSAPLPKVYKKDPHNPMKSLTMEQLRQFQQADSAYKSTYGVTSVIASADGVVSGPISHSHAGLAAQPVPVVEQLPTPPSVPVEGEWREIEPPRTIEPVRSINDSPYKGETGPVSMSNNTSPRDQRSEAGTETATEASAETRKMILENTKDMHQLLEEGGGHVKTNELTAISALANNRIETHVLAPIKAWRARYKGVKRRMKELTPRRLDLDIVRRRYLHTEMKKVKAMQIQAKVPEAVFEELAVRKAAYDAAQAQYDIHEGAVHHELVKLIEDCVQIREILASALLVEASAFRDAVIVPGSVGDEQFNDNPQAIEQHYKLSEIQADAGRTVKTFEKGVSPKREEHLVMPSAPTHAVAPAMPHSIKPALLEPHREAIPA